MKKLLCFVLMLVMVFAVTACGTKTEEGDQDNEDLEALQEQIAEKDAEYEAKLAELNKASEEQKAELQKQLDALLAEKEALEEQEKQAKLLEEELSNITPVTINALYYRQATEFGQNEQKMFDIIKEKTGVTFNFISYDSKEGKDLSLASGQDIDIFDCWHGGFAEYYKKDLIQPISADLVSKYLPDFCEIVDYDYSGKYFNDSEGNLWALYQRVMFQNKSIDYRADIFEQEGISVPATVEEFENVLATLQKLDPDTPPMVARYDYISYFLKSFTPYGYAWGYDEANDTLVHWAQQEGVKDYLATLRRWYENGYIPESYMVSMDEMRQLTNDNKLNLVCSHGLDYFRTSGSLYESVPGVEFRFMTPVNGTYQGGYVGDTPVNYNYCVVIHKDCTEEKVIGMLRFWNWGMQNYNMIQLGWEGISYEFEDKSKTYWDTILDSEGKKLYTRPFYTGYPFISSYSYDNLNCWSPSYNPAVKPEAQVWHNFIDKVMTANSTEGFAYLDADAMYSALYDYSEGIKTSESALDNAVKDIIMGQEPLSYWDQVVSEWLDTSGNAYIADRTRLFKELK